MKLFVQRVNKALVAVDGKIIGQIGKGYLVLFGVRKGDSEKEADYLVDKLTKLRVMADENDKMNLSVRDVGGEMLIISQFTLHADTKKGNRPSFVKAGDPKKAEELYTKTDTVNNILRRNADKCREFAGETMRDVRKKMGLIK